MLKNSMKIVAILLIAVMAVMVFSNTAFARIDLEAGFNDAEDKIENAQNVDDSAAESVAKMANSIIGVVQVVGMAVAVIMLIVLAIKYISAAPSDKAEIKKHAVVYVVGAVVLFAATGILEIVKNFSKNIG